MVTALSPLAISPVTMVRETTKNNNRVQDTTAEAISRLSDYFGSIQVSKETLILGEAAGGSDMAPKKRKVASKRKVRDMDQGQSRYGIS